MRTSLPGGSPKNRAKEVCMYMNLCIIQVDNGVYLCAYFYIIHIYTHLSLYIYTTYSLIYIIHYISSYLSVHTQLLGHLSRPWARIPESAYWLLKEKKTWNSTNKEPGNTTEIQIKIAMRVNILYFLLFLFGSLVFSFFLLLSPFFQDNLLMGKLSS